MELLEVIRGVDDVRRGVRRRQEFGEKLGKLTVETRDTAGFIVNRLLVPFLLDGIRGYEEGIGSIAEIDAAMKAGAATRWAR